MELNEFVAKALKDIIAGVTEARKEAGEGASIATSNHFKVEGLPANIVQDTSGALHSVVSFDVAVTTADASEAAAGIKILPFKLGGKLEASSATVSRIQFAIPLRLR